MECFIEQDVYPKLQMMMVVVVVTVVAMKVMMQVLIMTQFS